MNRIMEMIRKWARGQKIETSKHILRFCQALLIIVTAATFALAGGGYEVTALVELDVAIVGLCAAAHSFYYWKSKCENMQKYGREDGIEMRDGGNG